MRYKTLGFNWLCKQCLSHQSWLYLDSAVLRNPQRFHTAGRYAKITNHSLFGNFFCTFDKN